MEINEKKVFVDSGMDTDSSPEGVAPNDTIEAYNVRFKGTTDGEDGIATDIESSVILSGTRSTGINKGIGSDGFTRTRKGYLFVYNSQGFHQIVEIDYDTDVETIIFTNKTDSGGVDVMPLDPKWYVNDIKLINGKFFVFTDSNMQVCYINIDTLKAKTLGVLTRDDFSLIKPQPLIIPTLAFGDDTARSVNLLSSRLFQFSYYNTFPDYEDSALSSYSKVIVPERESTPAIGTDVSKSNHIIVTIDIGNNRVKSLNVAALIGGETVWYLVKTIDRADILKLTNTVVDAFNKIYEAYNPSTNQYSFAFYNDGNYPNLDSLYTDLPYDYVPIKAGAIEVLNGSILSLGDLTEGYDRPVVAIDISVGSYHPGIMSEPIDVVGKLTVLRAGDTLTKNFFGTRSHFRQIDVLYKGIAKTGDKLTIQIRDSRDHSKIEVFEFIVTILEDGNTLNALKAFSKKIPNSLVYNQDPSTGADGSIRIAPQKWWELGYAKIDLANVSATGASKSMSALKTNSSYQLALAHYDKFGRYFPIVTSDKLIAKTQSYAQTKGLVPSISWNILGKPPVDAVGYQWLLTKNNTHETTLYMTAKVDPVRTAGDYIVLNINPLMEFNEKNSSSVLAYDYTSGDRVTFLKRVNLTSNNEVWFNSPPVDVEVVDFEILVDKVAVPNTTNYLLKVRKSAAIVSTVIALDNILIEIYTPKKRTSVVGGKDVLNPTLFFEIGEQYPIVNGDYSVKSGEIRHGDSYFKTREMADGTDLNVIDSHPVEDFNFSDFYKSNYNSYGRPRTYNDVKRRDRKIACIRYSDTNIEGSQVNGLTRFFGERIYGEGAGQTSSEHGAINKMVQVGNYLWIIQDTICGSIPVNISIIEDQVSQQNVAVSDRLLNYIRYSDAGRYGMGGAKESFAQRPDGTLYFVDPYNSLPIRIGRDGVRPIPGKKIKFFRRTIQKAIAQGLKIVGYYDVFNDEFVLAVSQLGDVVAEFPFSDSSWRFLEVYKPTASEIAISIQPSKGTVVYNPETGRAIYKSNVGQTGTDNFTESFLVNGVAVTKRTCLNITAGVSNPTQFTFVDIVNAELNTLHVSNSVLIDGITMPAPISISSGSEYRINGVGSWITVPSTVQKLDTLEVRQTSSVSSSIKTDTVLTVGTISDTYSVTTKIIDVSVNAFAFNDVTDKETSTLYESNTVTIGGISQAVPISVVGGEYSINGLAYTSAAGTIASGSTVKVRRVSSVSYSASVGVTLTVGDMSNTYTIGTKSNVPTAFAFIDVTNRERTTSYESNSQVITGFVGSLPISIVNGEYSINGGLFTSVSGTIAAGSTVKVKRTSSGAYNSLAETTLTVGSLSDTYGITTKVAPPVAVTYSMTKDDNPHVVIILVPVVNGVNVGNIYGSSTGSFPGIKAGDTVDMYLVHPTAFQPWPAGSSARMDIVDNVGTIYDSFDVTTAVNDNLGAYSFVAQEGKSYHVDTTSNSASVSYKAMTFDMFNQSSSPLRTTLFQLFDNTDNSRVLHTLQDLMEQPNVGFNWLLDSGTGRHVVTNLWDFSLKYVLSNTLFGGAYTQEITVLPGQFGSFENIPKGSYRVTILNPPAL